MKITSTILSIPPYISTSWKNITSLHVEMQGSSPLLIATLVNGNQITIPHLDPALIESIFAAHSKYLELEQNSLSNIFPSNKRPTNPFPSSEKGATTLSVPMEFPFNPENMGAVLQHNPEDADAPDLPPPLLDKIASLSKTVGIADPNTIPKPEPHCNCNYCQIAKALHAGFEEPATPDSLTDESEEAVSEEDLTFRSWDINQTSEKLFIVQNPLDSKEHYSVYLGEPVGCTCGQKHCEHIRAVLNS
jgi:hypothetical protein